MSGSQSKWNHRREARRRAEDPKEFIHALLLSASGELCPLDTDLPWMSGSQSKRNHRREARRRAEDPKEFIHALLLSASGELLPSLQKLPLGRWGVDDFESEGGGFALERVDLPPAVLRFVELCPSIDEPHPIAQHSVNQAGQLGGHGLDGDWRPKPRLQSAELCSQIGIALT